MNLQEYLDQIQLCQDTYTIENDLPVHRLTTEYGIYDNWPILVKSSKKRLIKLLRNNGYTFISNEPTLTTFHLKPNLTVLSINTQKGLNIEKSLGFDNNTHPLFHIHKRNMDSYNLELLLHPYLHPDWQTNPSTTDSPFSWEIGLRNTILDLSSKLSEWSIHFSFPLSIGTSCIDIEEKASRIVYHPDRILEESFREV